MREEVCRFGPEGALEGVLCRPESPLARRSVVVLISAGLLHRVGPYRFHVHLARGLAALGHEVLRIDLAGIGDSARRDGRVPDGDGPVRDIGAALDRLQRDAPFERCSVLGLCSGADDALRAATADPRITGCIAIDGVAYRDPLWWVLHLLLHYPGRLASAAKWRDLAGRFRFADAAPVDYRVFPSIEATRAALRTLVERGCSLHLLYTGGVSNYYNHRHQFARRFPELMRSKCISVDWFPRMDHMAILGVDRERLLGVIVAHLQAGGVPREDRQVP